MKTKLIWIAMKKHPLHYILPLVVTYIVLPLIALSSISRFGLEQSCHIVVYATQSIIPAICLLFPMAYFNLWLENDGWEAMVSSTNSQYTISFGLGILIVCYTTMLIPAFFLFYSTYGFGWLEYLRLCSQCVFIMSLYYTCTIICRNVTLGGLPAVIYLFLCLSLNDRAEFSKFSILDLSNLASFMSMKKAVLLYCISLVLLWGTAKLERHNLTGFPKNR